jgi:uncharacterized Zn-finger protein
MPPFETIYIDTMAAACDGGGGALGHPRVFLNLSATGSVECPYCSRRFVNKAWAGKGPGVVTPGSGGRYETGHGDDVPGTPATGGPSVSPETAGARSSSASPAKP